MREEYLKASTILRSSQQLFTDSMALTQSPGNGVGKDASTDPPPSSKTSSTASEIPSPTKTPAIDIEHHDHHHHHHHHHHSVRHKHIHGGIVTETLNTTQLAPEIPITAIVVEIPGGNSPPKTDSIAGSSPEGRGRSRLVRRVARSSSEESTCSSIAGERDLALSNRVTELVGVYHQTGDFQELSGIARDDGIPGPLRRVCIPYLPLRNALHRGLTGFRSFGPSFLIIILLLKRSP